MKKLLRSRLALIGSIMTMTVVVFCLLGPLIAPYGLSEFSNELLSPPSINHYFGSDGHGRDLFSRILRGGLITLSIAVPTVLIAGVFGTLWGLMAAFTKGLVCNLLNRAMDRSV